MTVRTKAVETEQPDEISSQTYRRMMRQQRIKELTEEARTFDLQAVMPGAAPIAVIDGQAYRQGDPIGSFILKRVGNTHVEFQAEGAIFRLQMDQTKGVGQSGKSSSSRRPRQATSPRPSRQASRSRSNDDDLITGEKVKALLNRINGGTARHAPDH